MMKAKVNMCCSFCLNLGISQPHDHTIRNFGAKDKPITCPKLLQTECSYCHGFGHTKVYCHVLKSKKLSIVGDTHRVGASSEKKRVFIMDSDGFTTVSSKNSGRQLSSVIEQNKVQKVGMLLSAFGALNVDGDDSGDESTDVDDATMFSGGCVVGETENPDGVTWASVVTSTKKDVPVFATQQELRDRLGIKPGTLWADDDDDD